MTSVLELPDVVVTADVRDGTWTVDVPGGRHRVREWTWGERRRLIDSCVRPGPELDGGAFVDGLLSLLVRPKPARPSRPLVAAVALRVLGVAPGQQPPSLLEAEASFARAFGFGPSELDHQPAARLDQQLAVLPVDAHGPPVASGWTSIVVGDDDA